MIKRKTYKSVERLQTDLQTQWIERMDFYKKKYPSLDYNLEIQSMQEWIEDNYVKAKKRHAWNLFIQRWLSRARPAWNTPKQYPSEVDKENRKEAEFCKRIIEANPHDPHLEIYKRKLKEYENIYGKLKLED